MRTDRHVMLVVTSDRAVAFVRPRADATVYSDVRARSIVFARLKDEHMHIGTTVRLTFQPVDPDDGVTVVHTNDDTATADIWFPGSSRIAGDPADTTAGMFWDVDNERFEYYFETAGQQPGIYEWGITAVVDGYTAVEYANFNVRP